MRIMLTFSFILLMVSSFHVMGHGGGLDSDGCHVESSTGERHCHGSGSESSSSDQSGSTSSTGGYDRSYYGDWVDADGDCQDTRQEVLISQGTNIELNANGCRVVSGRWDGLYTSETFTDPSDLHIDHIVPLAEAHRSGASEWPSSKKRRFANSTDNLIAVEAGENMSKGARDPASWMPDHGACQYASMWVSVKNRWNLYYDHEEADALRSTLANCP